MISWQPLSSMAANFHCVTLTNLLLTVTYKPLNAYTHIKMLPLLARLSRLAGLTLAVLTVLVAGGRHSWVHAVTSGAVRRGAVGLRRRKAVHRLNGGLSWTLAAAGWDGIGWRGVQGAVQWWNGEVVLRLWGNTAGVTQDAHHLQTQGRRSCQQASPVQCFGSTATDQITIK